MAITSSLKRMAMPQTSKKRVYDAIPTQMDLFGSPGPSRPFEAVWRLLSLTSRLMGHN